ncbi:unnamed protein product [Oreochromis niloticus]|nr:unnamed protein product [Mustela putorius furo]
MKVSAAVDPLNCDRVSQHALAVVEVNEGERSVLLLCLYSGFIPEDSTVMWTRSDIDPNSIHLRQEGGDNLRGQNQRYRGRTSMNRYALITNDFSLTLRKPTKTDSGNYSCSISAGGEERRLGDIQLQVKDQQVEVKVEEGSESVILPCKTKPDLPKNTTVEWTRSEVGLITVHEYSNRNDDLMTQDEVYRDRTKMSEDLLRTGDLSLTLKQPTERDTGGYICTIYRDKDILRQKVVLLVKEPFPSWVKVLLVLLVLLVVSGGLLFYFRQYFMSGEYYQKVEVESGVESVQLPCKNIVNFLRDTNVEWKDRDNRMVHVYKNGSDQPGEQHQDYKDRTEIKRNLLKPADFSLTLKFPTDRDTNTYTCTISRVGNIKIKKRVELKVRVPQVEVDSGVESVQFPIETTIQLPEKAKVEWKNSSGRIVHVYESGSDQPEEQNHCYKDRTVINIDPLKPGDLSLTLKHPTDRDNSTYTCTVYSTDKKTVLMKKQVELKVKVPLVEVEDSGLESVQLAHKTTLNLPKDAKVEWTDSSYRMLHVYPSSSDQPEEQDRRYRGRTKMNDENGDLTLTLKHPTDWDRGPYTCTVYSREGNILLRKQVDLKVGVCQVEVEEGAESVQLPFKTTENLPEDVRVKWRDRYNRKLHVYQNGWRPEEQHQVYRDRTKMDEDLLRTGDLSLTLKQPTVSDSGRYNCVVESRNIYRYKTVLLKVKGRVQVQDQTGDIRNRSSSIDPTPLMADQSV